MANPYEEGIQAITGAVQNIDTTQVVDSISNVIQNTNEQPSVEQTVESDIPNSNSTEIALAKPNQNLDYAGRKKKNEEFYAFRKLPDGEEKTKAANEWAMKYHGMSYPDYEAKKKERKFRSIL